MSIRTPLLLALIATALMGCFGGDGMARADEATGNPDAFFVVQAAMTNEAEMELGRLAIDRAADLRVRQYAEQMVQEHQQEQEELQRIARLQNIELPQKPHEGQVLMIRHLSELEGRQFDQEYMNAMVLEHTAAVTMFENRAVITQDPEMKNWAERKTPKLKEHLEQAEKLNQDLSQAVAANP